MCFDMAHLFLNNAVSLKNVFQIDTRARQGMYYKTMKN